MTRMCLIFASVLILSIASFAQSAQSAQGQGQGQGQDPKQDPKQESKSATTKKKSEKHTDKKKTETKEKTARSEDLPKDVKKLIVQDTIQGAGKVATRGKSIKVNYTGWLYDPSAAMGRGKQFDSSIGKDPFTFKLGAGEVIKGWDDGFNDMKVGGKRKLIVPPEMGYGERGAGSVIPPNASLMFEVELIDVM